MTRWSTRLVPRFGSLRARLLLFLGLAVALTALVQGAFAYRTARTEADDLFDYHMQQTALALRAGLPIGAIAGAGGGGGSAGHAAGDPAEENYNFVVQVWTAEGLTVFQSGLRAALPLLPVVGYSTLAAHGSTYRVYTLRARSQVIQVAQDMATRRRLASGLALRTVWPTALMAPLLMLIVGAVVTASLAPVARVRRQVAQRQADELTPVGAAGLPDEIRPLVDELNLLFGRVRQAFDAQARFVADAAHELRSPLAALKLQVQGLRHADTALARETAIARLGAGIDRATRLVEQLLVLARQQATAANGAAAEPVDLAALARLVIAEAAEPAQARGIDLGLAEAQPASVVGHPEALRILLANLIDNALKYTPPGGAVDVSVFAAAPADAGTQLGRSAGPSGARLVVDDSGPGIPQAERDRVLDRFARGAGHDAIGSGLGLAIVKSIVEGHGGVLRLRRTERLGGLRVEVTFPAG